MSGVLIAVFATTLLAFTVKGALGFGPALFVVGLLSAVLGVKDAVILSSFTDLVSGIGVMYLNRKSAPAVSEWAFPAAMMAVSAGLSALLFARLASDTISLAIAAMLLFSGLWLVAGRPGLAARRVADADKRRDIRNLGFVCFGSGTMAGLTGIGGPFVAIYLASLHNKERFYGLIAPVLLSSALVRFGTYLATGQIDAGFTGPALVCLPALVIGITFGHWIKNYLPDRLFWLFSGLILVAISARLFFDL